MIYVNQIVLKTTSTIIEKGKWFYGLTATVKPANAKQTLRWSSSDSGVASVNQATGAIYANRVGVATITARATDGSGVSASMLFKVETSVPADYVVIDNSVSTLNKGDVNTFRAAIYPSNSTYKTLKWTSSNSNVLRINSSTGVAEAVGSGSADISVEVVGAYCCDRMRVNVTNNVNVKSIRLSSGSSASIVEGEQAVVYAYVSPSNATQKGINWSIGNDCVASLNASTSSSVNVLAKQKGSTKLTATAADGSGVSAQATISVVDAIPIQSITFDEPRVVMLEGSGYAPSFTVLPCESQCKSFVWSSDAPEVATVSKTTGCITAISAGKAIITVMPKNANYGKAVGRLLVTVACDVEKPDPDPNKGTEKHNPPNAKSGDPIDVFSGAHILDYTAMTLFGGQNLAFNMHYESDKLQSGHMGKGWSHNYEKFLQPATDGTYRVFNNPSRYDIYAPDSRLKGIYHCTTPGKERYKLTVPTDECPPSSYFIDCDSQSYEYYNAEGRITSIYDHHMLVTEITYVGSLINVTDKVTGKSLHIAHDNSNRVWKVYDDDNREVRFEYDSCSGMLVKIIDMFDRTLTYTYNDFGQVLTGTDTLGVRYFSNTYDLTRRIVKQLDANDKETRIQYECCNSRIITNREGDISRKLFDSSGMLTEDSNVGGSLKRYAYDSCFRLTKETDGKGNKTERSYDSYGDLVSVTDALGQKTTFTYDIRHNLTGISRQNGTTTVSESFTYDSSNNLLTHTDMRGTCTRYTYDANGMPASVKVGDKPATTYTYSGGRLLSECDPCGNITSYEYNPLGLMTKRTDALGNVTRFEYDCAGNVVKVTDALGNVSTTEFNGNFQKVKETDALGHITRFEYNGNMKNTYTYYPDGTFHLYRYDYEDRVLNDVSRTGGDIAYTYDPIGRLVKQINMDGGSTTYEYDDAGNITKETAPLGAVTTRTFDALNRVVSLTDDDGGVTTYAYDSFGRVVRTVNPASGVTVNTYSPAGDLLTETDPNGFVTTYTYDAYGNRLSVTDKRSNTTAYTYDALDRMLTSTDPLGHTTSYAYDALGNLIKVTDPLGRTVRYTYDALGRRTGVIDGKGNRFTTEYDALGNAVKTLDAKGKVVTQTTFNSVGQPLSVTSAANGTTSYTYQSTMVSSVTDPFGNVSEYVNDIAGHLVRVVDPLGGATFSSFNSLGLVTAMGGQTGRTNYTYDKSGRLATESTSSNAQRLFEYNALGLQSKVTSGNLDIKRFTYDAAGRMTGTTVNSDSTTYAYNAGGQLTSATDSQGTVTREYDAAGRLTRCTDTYGRILRYEYDAAGNLTRLTYPDNTSVTYAYDANNALTKVTDWAGRETTYAYDVNGRLTYSRKPDCSTVTTVYDDAGRVISTVDKMPSGEVISGFEYTYDASGKIICEKLLTNGSSMCYTYDNLNRLIKRTLKSAEGALLNEESYSYDAAGNMTDAPDSCFVYDANNRLTVFKGSSLEYDLEGNMLAAPVVGGSGRLCYDGSNRLISAGNNSYTYDAQDVRIKSTCGDKVRTFTYDTVDKLSRLVYMTDNGEVVKFVYGDGLIGEERSGAFRTYHFDYRGSTVAISNDCGSVSDRFEYDSYGQMTSHIGSGSVIFGYNGRDGVVTDENGLIYMRARYYTPSLKRFVNADIIAGEISNAVTLNRYAYANGNPVSNVDPFGLSADNKGVKYNRNASIKYAKKWSSEENGHKGYAWGFLDRLFNKRNPEYYNYSSNCANFVSQCLSAGGIEMTDDWHSYKLDGYSDTQIEVGSWALAIAINPLLSPFIKKAVETNLRNKATTWDITSAWSMAQDQFDYFRDESNGYINGEVITITSKEQIQEVIDNGGIQKGDLLYWNNSGKDNKVHHATMISDVTKDDIKYTGNTATRFNNSLSKNIENETVYIVRIRDYIGGN